MKQREIQTTELYFQQSTPDEPSNLTLIDLIKD